jgi:hypothetical protein
MPVARNGSLSASEPTGAMKFSPDVFSGKLVEKFYQSTVMGEIASTDYEGDIAGFGANVIIRTVPDVAVNDYVIGTGLTNQYPSRSAVTLAIDKAKSFAVAINTVDARQSDLDTADIFANEGSIKLKIAADADMLQTIPAQVAAANTGATAGRDSINLNMGTTAAPRSVSAANVVDFLVEAGQVLDEQDVSEEGRWIVLPPWMIARIKRSDLRIASLSGDGISILRNGKVGEIDRFKIFQSRSLLNQTTPAVATNVVFGHSAGLTFASQIVDLRLIDNPNDFGYLCQGLMVYGYQVVEPLYVGRGVLSRG